MKEIKTFLRPECMDSVVHALLDAGIRTVTVLTVRAVGAKDDDDPRFQIDRTFFAPYRQICKLELVCRDEDVERALHLISSLGRTGEPGDGIVYVSGVDRVLKIRTGEEGPAAVDRLK